MSDLSANSEVPSLHWTELQLMQYLAQAWSMPDPGHISVIGRLRFAETGSFGFLENLHDATTGVKLPSLAPVSQLQQVRRKELLLLFEGEPVDQIKPSQALDDCTDIVEQSGRFSISPRTFATRARAIV